MRVAAAVVFGVALATGCASSATLRDVRQIAGSWQGRASNVLGHAPATITINEDGTYTGTMFLDDGERRFAGAIVVLDGRRARYMGTAGGGSVRLEGRDAKTLRFVQDGGGGGASFTPAPMPTPTSAPASTR
ncbi:MAG TPA: hypothetical protein VGL09_09285 [Methylomirabilota bacterium]|jgi:hypothetical protein